MCRTLAFVAISAVLAQVAFSQAIIPINNLLNNPLLLNSLGANLISLSPNIVNYDAVETVVSSPCSTPIVQNPCVQTPIVQTPIVQTPIVQAPVVPATTTIIQDSTVANNLANALQLLIVSNLLSNTLPTMGDVIIPAPVEVVSPCAPYTISGLDVVGPLTSYSPLSFAGLNGLSYAIL